MQRRRFKQPSSIDQRLAEQAGRMRKEAQGTPPGSARDKLLHRARQAEEAVQMQEWLGPPSLKTPR